MLNLELFFLDNGVRSGWGYGCILNFDNLTYSPPIKGPDSNHNT